MIYKQVTKFLILSVLIAVNIISTTINSDFVLAAAPIKPKPNVTATLTVTNIIRANCPQGLTTKADCPEGKNTGMLTKIWFGGQVYDFPVGPCCGEGPAVHVKFNIPVGEKYRITSEVQNRCLDKEFHYGDSSYYVTTYCYEHANIQGSPPFGTGGCTGINACEATMGPDGAYARVNYHWKYLYISPQPGNVGFGDHDGSGGDGGNGGHTGDAASVAGNGGNGGNAGSSGNDITSGNGGSEGNGGNGGNGGNATAHSGSTNGGNGGNGSRGK